MPQMSPLMWIFLMFLFVFFYLFLFVSIYFKVFSVCLISGHFRNDKFLFLI